MRGGFEITSMEKQFMTNTLTPLERLERTIDGRHPDRLPILVLTKMFGLKQLGIPLNECLRSSPEVYVKSQWYCVEELGHEALWAFSGLWEINEIMRYQIALLRIGRNF